VKNLAGFPTEFDAAYYRACYPELALTSDAQAEAHFRDHGVAVGLNGSPLVHREHFLKEIREREEGDALEIGPSWSPILRGPRVAYLDVFNAAELRARAKKHGVDPELCPTVIDFVGDIADVDRKFDYVVSSHSIEHQPDLVHHLKCVRELLNPGGRYYLIIPDKRFCFDARKAESTIAGVLQAHKEKRTHHTLQSVIEGAVYSTHNDAVMHWQAPPDVHAWYFTPTSFRAITSTLFKLGLTGLEPLRVFNTPRNSLEFCAVLQKVEP